MRSIPITLLTTLTIVGLARYVTAQQLTVSDRFEIFTQLNLHQTYIDHPADCVSSQQYASLYWPEGTFRVIDPDRDITFTGPIEMRRNYDYAHTVFPLASWAHSFGPFEIKPGLSEIQASVHWRWRVDWKANTSGVVSTGTYDDVFEKRNGTWKTLHRVSRDDPNWPLYLFQPYSAQENTTFKSLCGDS